MEDCSHGHHCTGASRRSSNCGSQWRATAAPFNSATVPMLLLANCCARVDAWPEKVNAGRLGRLCLHSARALRRGDDAALSVIPGMMGTMQKPADPRFATRPWPPPQPPARRRYARRCLKRIRLSQPIDEATRTSNTALRSQPDHASRPRQKWTWIVPHDGTRRGLPGAAISNPIRGAHRPMVGTRAMTQRPYSRRSPPESCRRQVQLPIRPGVHAFMIVAKKRMAVGRRRGSSQGPELASGCRD